MSSAPLLAIALALAASVCAGATNFLSGRQSRSVSVFVVVAVVHGVGLLCVAVAIVVTGEALPGARTVWLGLAAGAVSVTALVALFQALAVGTMSVVAPLSAIGVALPVVVGLATGDELSTGIALGMAAIVAGVLMASRPGHEGAERRSAGRLSIALALLAAAGFGGYYTLADAAADGSILWLLGLERTVSVPVAVGLALALRARAPGRGETGLLVGAGALNIAGTGLYALASTRGALSLVALAATMYPVVTVLLARALLAERMAPVQAAGVVAALIGVVLIIVG